MPIADIEAWSRAVLNKRGRACSGFIFSTSSSRYPSIT